MTKLSWDAPGSRRFETGVERVVLYMQGAPGIAWNGVTAVRQRPSGGGVAPYYIDGVKYLQVADLDEFAATLEALTYPDEFAAADGSAFLSAGFEMDEQPRQEFGLSYRTLVGNDIQGASQGYKLHFVYNALAASSESAFSAIGDRPELTPFSWELTTTPLRGPIGRAPYSHLSIDSTKRRAAVMRAIEAMVYGTATTPARLPSLNDIETVFLNPPPDTLKVKYRRTIGLHPLIEDEDGDFVGKLENGLYTRMSRRIWYQRFTPGLYTYGPAKPFPMAIANDLETGLSPLIEQTPADLLWDMFDEWEDGILRLSDDTRLLMSEHDGYYTLGVFSPYQMRVEYDYLTGLSPFSIQDSGDLEDGPIADGLLRKSKTSKLKETKNSGYYNTTGIPITRNLRLLLHPETGFHTAVTDFFGDLFDDFGGTGLFPMTDDSKLFELGGQGIYTYGEAPTNQGLILASPSTGLNVVIRADLGDVDMREISDGLYSESAFTRLRESVRSGLYFLGLPSEDFLGFMGTGQPGIWRLVRTDFGDLFRSPYYDELGVYRASANNGFVPTEYPGIYRRTNLELAEFDIVDGILTGIKRLQPAADGDLVSTGGTVGIYQRSAGSRLYPTVTPGVSKFGQATFDIVEGSRAGINRLRAAYEGDLASADVSTGIYVRTPDTRLTAAGIPGVYLIGAGVDPVTGMLIIEDSIDGIAALLIGAGGDFAFPSLEDGIYQALSTSRLKPTAEPGIFDLEI